ncbi:VOC family protein [Thermorudis peleae]|uniref:VOC family protein n=1 Tax=Thermorudis peleae TaxID=1382356 RepID=UPI000570DD8E|nr:VOC family protein [Thermorudis peleae]MBX6754789.1 VOC family protein [Thermorudis peleae]
MDDVRFWLDEPRFDVAHLAHVELLTPDLDGSVRFFTDYVGLSISGERGHSVYLRGWDDYAHHTLKLTAGPTAAMEHFAYRTTSPEALARCVALAEQAGLGIGWIDGDEGHGPAYRFRTSDGHIVELLWEVEWYQAPPTQRPALKNQASRFPARGCNARRLDHINLFAADVRSTRLDLQRVLGLRFTEAIIFDDGSEKGAWLTANNKGYEVAITEDQTGARGRFHHVCYAVDTREEVLRAADIAIDQGVRIEYGPHKHAIQQTVFLYLIEPGGHRVEIGCPGARLVLAPDWTTVVWSEAERKRGQAWGLATVSTFHTYGTPPVDPVAAGR